MTVTLLPFQETTFFRDVRDRMQAGHGVVAASGRDLPSVSAVPAFDQMGVLAWPASQTLFVATAADPQDPDDRQRAVLAELPPHQPLAGAVAGRSHRVVWDLDDLL